MQETVNIFIKAAFIDNMVFAYFLGMCSYLAVSKTIKSAFGLGLSVLFVLSITVPLNYLVDIYLLKPGALKWVSPDFSEVDLSFLNMVVFIAVVAAVVQILEMLLDRFFQSIYVSLGVFLPLIAVNCAILGGSLFMQQKEFTHVGQALTYGTGSGVGWFLAVVALAAIREKIAYSNVPAPLRGLGITFIITGLLSIAFMSFMGIKI